MMLRPRRRAANSPHSRIHVGSLVLRPKWINRLYMDGLLHGLTPVCAASTSWCTYSLFIVRNCGTLKTPTVIKTFVQKRIVRCKLWCGLHEDCWPRNPPKSSDETLTALEICCWNESLQWSNRWGGQQRTMNFKDMIYWNLWSETQHKEFRSDRFGDVGLH